METAVVQLSTWYGACFILECFDNLAHTTYKNAGNSEAVHGVRAYGCLRAVIPENPCRLSSTFMTRSRVKGPHGGCGTTRWLMHAQYPMGITLVGHIEPSDYQIRILPARRGCAASWGNTATFLYLFGALAGNVKLPHGQLHRAHVMEKDILNMCIE